MRPQCQKQIGVKPRLWLNAVTIPYAVICPHFAEEGSRWCKDHQWMDEKHPLTEVSES